MTKFKNRVSKSGCTGWLFSTVTALAIIGTCGCAHTHRGRAAFGGLGIGMVSQVTAVVTGPAALLLTNTPGYQADYELTFDDNPSSSTKPGGQLDVRQGKIRLELGSQSHSGSSSGFVIVWDAIAGNGFIVSRALQGFALLSNPLCSTNWRIERISPATEPSTRPSNENVGAIANSGNEPAQIFQLFRGTDGSPLPTTIHSLQASPEFTLTLDKIQTAPPPEDSFALPDGFTKYDSEKALLAELASRQQDYRSGQLGRGTYDSDHEHPRRAPARQQDNDQFSP